MKRFLRTALIVLLWWAALRTLASGMAENIKETAVSGYFPVAALAFLLGWAGRDLHDRRKQRLTPARSNIWHGAFVWIITLVIGGAFAFLHNGNLSAPLLNTTREAARYQWARLEALTTRIPADPSGLQAAQTQLTAQYVQATRRLGDWIAKMMRGEKNEDAMVRQIVWSFLTLALAAWAGWSLRGDRRALPALLPSTAFLAYLQYYSEPDPLNFQIHLALVFMLAALSEGSAALRDQPQRGLSGDTLTAAFLACTAIIALAGFAPSLSARAIKEALEARNRAEQNDRAAQALGLQPADVSTPNRYAPPGLPRERLLQGSPELSRTLVFTVRTGDLPPMQRLPRDERPPRYYWRTSTYDAYTGHGWAVSINESRAERSGILLIEMIPTGYRYLGYDLTLSAPSPLAWTGQLIRANQPLSTAWRTLPNSRARSLDPLRGADLVAVTAEATVFHVESILPAFTVEQLRAASMNYPDWVRDQYLTLPPDLPARVHTLARELTADQASAYDRARAIEAYLRRFPYTLDVPVPPADRDVADYFLFDLQTGYCDYYATAMVVLARAAGLPARLVSGYASGEYIPSEAVYRVRELDAHSWVEVYFTGLGWIEFEPTANRPAIERAEGSASAPDDVPVAQVAPAAPPSWLKVILQNLSTLSWKGWLTGILLAAFLFFFFSLARDRLRQNTPVQTIAGIYKKLYRLGRPLLGETERVHTPTSFSRALLLRLSAPARSNLLRDILSPAPAELNALTDLYIRAIYSPVVPTQDETKVALKLWRRVSWRLRLFRVATPKR